MTPDEWFERFVEQLPGAPREVSPDERSALLDLARIAAHSSERWTAPVTTYLAGVALADTDPSDRAVHLRRLVDSLEPPA